MSTQSEVNAVQEPNDFSLEFPESESNIDLLSVNSLRTSSKRSVTERNSKRFISKGVNVTTSKFDKFTSIASSLHVLCNPTQKTITNSDFDNTPDSDGAIPGSSRDQSVSTPFPLESQMNNIMNDLV